MHTTDNQFGFKKSHSTDLCVYGLKEIVNIYKQHSSPLFICFLDASKAFDKLNYWLLFDKLIKRNIPVFFIKILAYWYSSQHISVQWGNTLSVTFTVSNGVKQGGILSPMFFNIYMDDLSKYLNDASVGCMVNSCVLNHFIYADDMCVVAPSAKALQLLLDVCIDYAEQHGIVYNKKKSVCMCMKSRKYKLLNIPSVKLGDTVLIYVETYKYLGCIINCLLNDNDDIKRTLRGIYARSNMLSRKFYNCSDETKRFLFQTYCTNFYCIQLWWFYNQESLRKVRVAFNNSFRYLMGYDRRCSASGMFVGANIDAFDILRRKVVFNFTNRLQASNNKLIVILYKYRQLYPLPSVCEFYRTMYTNAFRI